MSVVFAGIFFPVSLFAQDSAPKIMSRTAGGVAWKNVTELKAAAAAGNPQACAQLGEQLLRGERVPQDKALAVLLLEQAARGGVGSAAFRIGMLLDDGDGVAQDRVRALAYFRAAAAGGVTQAFHNVGAAYAGAHGVKRDYVEALGWLILAKKRGDDSDAEQAVRARIQKLNHPEWIAAGETRSPAIARELAAGSVVDLLPPPAPLNDSATGAATAPPSGAAIKVISVTGNRWEWPSFAQLEQAAERGEPDALAALGQLLLEGKVVPEDSTRAVATLERGAKAGSADAALQLAEFYRKGEKIASDLAKAFQFNLQAARLGSLQAMFNTGAFLANGTGTERNFTEGLAWLVVAKHYGIDRGSEQKIRDYLAATKPDQIPIAEQRAAELQHEIEAAHRDVR